MLGIKNTLLLFKKPVAQALFIARDPVKLTARLPVIMNRPREFVPRLLTAIAPIP